MTQGFSFSEALQPPAQNEEPGGFSFADALGAQPAPIPEPAAPGTFVSPGGAAFVPPKSGIRRPKVEAAPAPVPAAPKEPAPYRDRRDALDDAVNLLEEGYDQKQVVEGFKNLGITMDEIVRHGQNRKSEYFRQQAALPPSKQPAGAAQPVGEMKAFEPGVMATVANTFKRADASLGDMATGFLFSSGAFDPDQAAWQIRQNARQRAAASPSQDIQRGMEAIGNAQTYGDAITAMYQHPKATFNMLVDSLLITAPTLAASLALAPAGAAVRAGTTFAGSGGTEYTSVMTDVLQDKGIDLNDAPKVAKALSDPKIIQEMKDKGAKRGLIVGAFDALSMGLAGKFMRPANELIAAGKLSGAAAKKATIAAWGKEVGLQAGAGAGGEFLAQQATGDNKPAEVLLEGLAEVVTAPLEVRSNLREARELEAAAQRAGLPVPPKIAGAQIEPTGFSFDEAKGAPVERVEPTFSGELPTTPGGRVEPTLEGAAPAIQPAAPSEPQARRQPTQRLAPEAVEQIPGMPTGEELAEPPKAPEETQTSVTPVTLPQDVAPGNLPNVGSEFEGSGWVEQENKINKKTGKPTLEDGKARYRRVDDRGFKQTVVVKDGKIQISNAVSPVIELTNSILDDEAPVRGQVHVGNSNVQGITLTFIPDKSSSGTATKMSPRAVQQYKDGVPIEKIVELEFSDAGGIRPDGSLTPHTTVGKLVSTKSAAPAEPPSTATSVTPPAAPATVPVKPTTAAAAQPQTPAADAEEKQKTKSPQAAPSFKYNPDAGSGNDNLVFFANNTKFALTNVGGKPQLVVYSPSGPIVFYAEGKQFDNRSNVFGADEIKSMFPGLPNQFVEDLKAWLSSNSADSVAGQKIADALNVLTAPAAPPAAAAPAPTPVKPTTAAAALPETPTVPPATKPKEFEPAAEQQAIQGLPIREVPITDLKLSKDVPQFKIGASETGVVEPLGGKFERTGVAPIQVWQRLDGSLEIISGRHRFDLAKRSGEKTIPAQIHREADGFDAVKAATLDAELNIRDGQGKVKDYVNYFKASGIDRQEAESRGLLARATGKRSFTIANQGSEELIAAVRSDQIGDEAAYYIALNAPNDARLQGVGIKAIMDGKSMNTAVNMMQAVKALASEQDTTTDMFGFDDSALKEAEEMAKLAAQKQREIQTRLSAISGAAKNPAVAKAEGIDIRDPEAIKRRIDELRQLKAAWENWSTSPELVAEIRAERGQAAPTLAPVEPVISAQTEEELRQKAEREAEAEKRQREEKAEAERKAKADAERDEFVLTGSDRAADEAAARGQKDIFGAAAEPTYEEKIAKVRKLAEKLLDKGQERYEETELDGKMYQVRTRTFEGKLFGSELSAVQEAIGDAKEVTLVNTDKQVMTLTFTGKYVGEGRNVRIMDSQYAPAESVEPAKSKNPIDFLKASGFERVPSGSEEQYQDRGGNRYLTLKRGPVRVALAPGESLFVDDRGSVIRADDEGNYTIAALLVDPEMRGQGEARKALDLIVKAADKFDVTLFIEPSPLADKPMSQEKLIDFYSSFGFMSAPDAKNRVLVREPGAMPDQNESGFRGASDEEVKDVANTFASAQSAQDDENVTRIFDAPDQKEIVRLEDKARKSGFVTIAEAKKRIAEWKKNAQKQGESGDNSNKIVLSLFDLTGEWSKPWEEAGYQVFRFDIQDDPEMGDVNKFSAEFFNDLYGAFEGQDIYAVLAACPCTDFASSGARHFAAKDADGRTVESVQLVQQTLATIEYFKPSIWAIENPVGRIEKLTGLPPWRLSFNPNHFGDPYTKKTLLWGRFNADLPIAPVEATEGSKMHRMYGGKSKETKNARSVTPEGFAYAFFQANNAIDNPVMAVANKYDMMDPAVIKQAVDAGMTDEEIANVVDDPYYFDTDYKAANKALKAAVADKKKAEKPAGGLTPEQIKNAQNNAADFGGEVVWQKGDYALIRGYSVMTGDPVYIPSKGTQYAKVDIETFTGDAFPPEIRQEMIAAKKKAEEEDAKAHAKNPFIKFVDGVAVSQSISPELEGVVRDWKKLLKLDAPIYVGTIEDAKANKSKYTGPHRRIGSGTLDANERGSMRRMSDGSYYILFKDSTSPTLKLEVLAHEMGHIHERLVYQNASDEEKKALADAHRKWLERQKGKTAQELINALRGRSVQRRTKVAEGMTAEQMTAYWKSFSEWYADQVSRWAVSGKTPVTIVEKFFKRLGNQLRRFYQQLRGAKYLPDETFVQYIERVTEKPTEIGPENLDVEDRAIEAAPGKEIGAGVMGQRMVNAADRFRKAAMSQHKLTKEQADAAMARLLRVKVLTLDPITGQFQLKDGRFWNRDVLLRAAGEEDKPSSILENIEPTGKKLPPGRSPELAAAAKQLERGEITAAEFDELVNKYKPIPVYFSALQPATQEQVYNALDSAKREKIDPNIPEGYQVGLRLDIPAFNRHGVFVVSIHEKRTPSSPGKVIGYSSAASIKDVTFGVGNQKEALKIAAGAAKDAIQTMEGKYVPMTPEEAFRIADDAILSGDWVQVGFDPTRHAYFFDRSTTQPVVSADEVIQIGNMILAKGVKYASKDSFLYNLGARSEAPSATDLKSAEQIREDQIKLYASIRARLAKVPSKVAKGEVNLEMQATTAHLMQKARELQAAIKETQPRLDSPERFLARALEEYDAGNISEEVLGVIRAAYAKEPELLNGLLLSVRKPPKGRDGSAGGFSTIDRLILLYKGSSGVSNPTTIRHELTHSLEQMMLPEQRMVVVQAWGKALARAIKQNPDEMHQRYFNAVLDFLDSPTPQNRAAAAAALPSYDMYQYMNPSEFWAVNAEKLMAAQLGGNWDKFKRSVRKLWEGMKKVLGFDNRYDIHKVFNQVMGGSKERLSYDALVSMVMGTGENFVTLNNIQDEKDLMEKYNRPHTPMLDQTPTKTFITRQFKNGKEFFEDAVENPKEAIVGTGKSVMDGLTQLRMKNVWYGSGLESRDFAQYEGGLRTSEGLVTASVALDNAIRSGNIGVEVIFRGGIKFDEKTGNFVAVEKEKGMRGVYEAESKLKSRLGDQLGTDIIQGYLEAKRSISIMDELYERESAFEDAKQNLEAMRALGREPEEIAQAEALVNDTKTDLDAIKKAASSVNMSEEEMYEFAALDQKHPELRDLMDNWTAINQNLLRFWRQVGLLSQGRYETLSSIKDYVPWYRIMNDEEDVHSPIQSTTRSMTNIGREKLFKRGKPMSVVDFRAKAGQQDFKIQPSSVVSVEVNGQKVNPDLVTATPDGSVRIDMPLEENDLVVFKTNREIENIIDNMTRNVMRMTMNGIRQYAANRIVLEYASRNADGKIMVFPSVDKDRGRFNWIVNGKKVVVEIQDPLVAASIYGMENLNLQMWKPLAMVANFTRRTITLSGVFQIKQVFKDAPTAAMVTGVKNPLALIGGAYKGFVTSLTNTDPVVDILKAAGIGGYMSPARTPEADIKRRIGIMNRNVFSFVIKGLDHIGDASDMAQRVATYKRVMAETGDEAQALFQAANVINFLHHGSAGYAQAIVKTVPFFGAYANATDVLVQALLGGGLKGMSRKKALLRLGTTTAILASMTVLYAMLAGADPEYDELDDQTKLRNIMIPGTKIMLPMNTSAAYFFKAIPELIYNIVTREGTENEMDRRQIRRALGEAARDMLLGPEPIPAGIKPLVEVAINHNFFTGRPVIPEGLKDVEAAEQYLATTSELGKKLSAMLTIPGTDNKRVLSPIEADHLVRGVLGTAGAMAQWFTNSIGAIAETRPEPSARETPITGSFLREEVPRGREDLFYDFKEAVDKKYNTYQKMLDREDFDAADAYIEKYGDVAAMKDYINETETELKEINAEIRRLGETRSKDETPKQRREQIEDYQRLKQEILEPVKDLRREAFGTMR